MAQTTSTSKVDTPDTLPADFFSQQPTSNSAASAPDTLPADFDFEKQPTDDSIAGPGSQMRSRASEQATAHMAEDQNSHAMSRKFVEPRSTHYIKEGLKGGAQAFNPVAIGQGLINTFEHPEETLKAIDPDTWIKYLQSWYSMSQEDKDEVAQNVGNLAGSAVLGKIITSPEVPGAAKSALMKATGAVQDAAPKVVKSAGKVARSAGPPLVGYGIGKVLDTLHPGLGTIGAEVGSALGLSVSPTIRSLIKKLLDIKEEAPNTKPKAPIPPLKPMQNGATAARRAEEAQGPKAAIPPVRPMNRPEPTATGPKAPIPPIRPMSKAPEPTTERPKAPIPPIKPMNKGPEPEPTKPKAPIPPLSWPNRGAATATEEGEGEGVTSTAKPETKAIQKASEETPGHPQYKLPAPYEANMKAKAQSGIEHLRKQSKSFADYAKMTDEEKRKFWDEAHYTPDRLDHRGKPLVNRSKIPSGVDSNVEAHMQEVMSKLPAPKPTKPTSKPVAPVAQPKPNFTEAPAPAIPYERLNKLMDKLEPGNDKSTYISTKRLRDASELSKASFDKLMLKYRSEGKIYLAEDDQASSRSQADRDNLIDGGNGKYYVAVSRLQ